MRGEYSAFFTWLRKEKGSPPHARGIPHRPRQNHCEIRITPACAGNTLCRSSPIVAFRDHPRMRGEYLTATRWPDSSRGSPPHARGIQPRLTLPLVLIGITPACAGNTRSRRQPGEIPRDHPRMRGEYTDVCALEDGTQGSPPHARGIRTVLAVDSVHQGITPACAGNTECRLLFWVSVRDHPRMRGEYYLSIPGMRFCLGSPPHARGIRGHALGSNRQSGITPACAGNTYFSVLLACP